MVGAPEIVMARLRRKRARRLPQRLEPADDLLIGIDRYENVVDDLDAAAQIAAVIGPQHLCRDGSVARRLAFP
jgi:hypothetical protein